MKKIFFLSLLISSLAFSGPVILKNQYIDKGKLYSDEVVLTAELYQSRSRIVVETNGYFYVGKNTLLEIDPGRYFSNGYVSAQGRKYQGIYHIFARSGESEVRVMSSDSLSSRQLKIAVDSQAPVSFLLAAPHFLRLSNRLILPAENRVCFPSSDSLSGMKDSHLWFNGKTFPSLSWVSNLQAGLWRAVAVDAVGNSNIEILEVVIDREGPRTEARAAAGMLLSELSPGIVAFSGDDVVFELSAEDICPPCEIWWTSDLKSGFNVYGSALTLTNSQKLWYYSVDALGNTSDIQYFQVAKSAAGGINVK